MFSTFKYDPETRQVQQLRSAFDPVTARSNQHQACNNCHAKKLRCSGEKSGCERCIAASLVCEYTRSASRPSRRPGSASRPKKPSSSSASSDSAPAGDTSPSPSSGSGSHSRVLTPSPPLAPQHPDFTTTTPRPIVPGGRPFAVSAAAAAAAHDAFLGGALGLGLGLDADLAPGSLGFAAGEGLGFAGFPQAGVWQPSAVTAALAADPSFLGGFGGEPGATPDQFFAMYPDLTQFPPDQDPQGQYWGEQ